MKVFKDFLSEYGATLIYAIISAILGYIGIVVKSLFARIANDKTKKDVVATCVRAVEQIFTDLHGSEKLHKCIDNVTTILDSKGIKASPDEIYMLIEAAVKDMNMSMKDMFDTKPQDDSIPFNSIPMVTLYSNNESGDVEQTDEVQE